MIQSSKYCDNILYHVMEENELHYFQHIPDAVQINQIVDSIKLNCKLFVLYHLSYIMEYKDIYISKSLRFLFDSSLAGYPFEGSILLVLPKCIDYR